MSSSNDYSFLLPNGEVQRVTAEKGKVSDIVLNNRLLGEGTPKSSFKVYVGDREVSNDDISKHPDCKFNIVFEKATGGCIKHSNTICYA